LLQGGKAGCEWPDFQALGVRAHPSLGWGPIHRGRYGGISLLVLADQESSDDLFTARAMTGDAGQRFQSWLRAAGLTSKYAIVRVLPVDTADLPAATVNDIVDHPQVVKVYGAIVDAIRRPARTSARWWRSAPSPPAWPATSTAADTRSSP
jgi:hypothetical protein